MTRGGSSRKGKPSGSKSVYPEVEPGYNARAVEFLRAIRPQGKIDKTDVDALRARFEHYLDMCAQYDFKVSNLNAYAAMGITRVDASLFSRDARHPERAEFIQQVQDYCSGYRECLMSDGKMHPAIGIFWQKNYDGMRDTVEHIAAPSIGTAEDIAKIAERYADQKAAESMIIDQQPSGFLPGALDEANDDDSDLS